MTNPTKHKYTIKKEEIKYQTFDENYAVFLFLPNFTAKYKLIRYSDTTAN